MTKNVEDKREGNYASSEISSLSANVHRDLGLTLLPGSQIQRRREELARPSAEFSFEIEDNVSSIYGDQISAEHDHDLRTSVTHSPCRPKHTSPRNSVKFKSQASCVYNVHLQKKNCELVSWKSLPIDSRDKADYGTGSVGSEPNCLNEDRQDAAVECSDTKQGQGMHDIPYTRNKRKAMCQGQFGPDAARKPTKYPKIQTQHYMALSGQTFGRVEKCKIQTSIWSNEQPIRPNPSPSSSVIHRNPSSSFSEELNSSDQCGNNDGEDSVLEDADEVNLTKAPNGLSTSMTGVSCRLSSSTPYWEDVTEGMISLYRASNSIQCKRDTERIGTYHDLRNHIGLVKHGSVADEWDYQNLSNGSQLLIGNDRASKSISDDRDFGVAKFCRNLEKRVRIGKYLIADNGLGGLHHSSRSKSFSQSLAAIRSASSMAEHLNRKQNVNIFGAILNDNEPFILPSHTSHTYQYSKTPSLLPFFSPYQPLQDVYLTNQAQVLESSKRFDHPFECSNSSLLHSSTLHHTSSGLRLRPQRRWSIAVTRFFISPPIHLSRYYRYRKRSSSVPTLSSTSYAVAMDVSKTLSAHNGTSEQDSHLCVVNSPGFVGQYNYPWPSCTFEDASQSSMEYIPGSAGQYAFSQQNPKVSAVPAFGDFINQQSPPPSLLNVSIHPTMDTRYLDPSTSEVINRYVNSGLVNNSSPFNQPEQMQQAFRESEKTNQEPISSFHSHFPDHQKIRRGIPGDPTTSTNSQCQKYPEMMNNHRNSVPFAHSQYPKHQDQSSTTDALNSDVFDGSYFSNPISSVDASESMKSYTVEDIERAMIMRRQHRSLVERMYKFVASFPLNGTIGPEIPLDTCLENARAEIRVLDEKLGRAKKDFETMRVRDQTYQSFIKKSQAAKKEMERRLGMCQKENRQLRACLQKSEANKDLSARQSESWKLRAKNLTELLQRRSPKPTPAATIIQDILGLSSDTPTDTLSSRPQPTQTTPSNFISAQLPLEAQHPPKSINSAMITPSPDAPVPNEPVANIAAAIPGQLIDLTSEEGVDVTTATSPSPMALSREPSSQGQNQDLPLTKRYSWMEEQNPFRCAKRPCINGLQADGQPYQRVAAFGTLMSYSPGSKFTATKKCENQASKLKKGNDSRGQMQPQENTIVEAQAPGENEAQAPEEDGGIQSQRHVEGDGWEEVMADMDEALEKQEGEQRIVGYEAEEWTELEARLEEELQRREAEKESSEDPQEETKGDR